MSTTTTGCPECDGALRQDGTETVCDRCGLVVGEDTIDRGPEWRSFADDDIQRARTGAPLTRSRHDRGLSTDIGRSTRLKGRKRRQMARLRREHRRAQVSSKRERNQIYAFTEIRRVVGSLGLSDAIRDRACVLFESAQNEDLLQGRSLEGFAAAAVYATCRTEGVARTVEELCRAARADPDELRAAYDALNRDLGLPTGPIDPREYVPRFATELDLSEGVRSRAEELVTEARDRNIVGGRNPAGVAAACLYTAAQERGVALTQAEAAEVGDVTPVTLRGTYTELQS
ncbi:transcription initiation factor IIB family protein [Halomicroarcula sp. F13]|uniref:Transcription initiation factor IIB n=1 Tax=Haloarcula rubra TaxID=2487747 RepID=A0AAW4PN33_9EURY|nr:transcription initiation factor IIB family protein [Halomicroarcula rubra]MBX0322443.1 transcription initiation factor IIB family protein [Halomicroarcula rubra]